MVDDILAIDATREELDQHLYAILQHLAKAMVTLNSEKCVYRRNLIVCILAIN